MGIAVQTYAGYKGDERPVSFLRGGRTVLITEIVDRWYDPDYTMFRVIADDGWTYLLRHDMTSDSWDMESATLSPEE